MSQAILMAIYKLTTRTGERLLGPTGLAVMIDDADLDQRAVDAIELLDVGEVLGRDVDFIAGWQLERAR